VTEELLLGEAGEEEAEPPEPFSHCCCADWVLGPMTPSIAPGSQPWDFSCCCSWRIESLPALDLAEAEPLDAALGEEEASIDDCGDDALCEVRSEDDGDWEELLLEFDCAKAVPVASNAAAAMASLLEVIGCSFRLVGKAERAAPRGRAPARAGVMQATCPRWAWLSRVMGPRAYPKGDTRVNRSRSFYRARGALQPASIRDDTVECARMHSLAHLFQNNRAWSERIRRDDPEFFTRLSRQQRPKYLWIGCSDSRVPANEIVDLAPGELFVHRNVANVVVHSDLNCLSVMQFAIELLRVEHIIVCGHYGCSGVGVAMENRRIGIADNWLRHVQDVGVKHGNRLAMVPEGAQRHDRLCELNVVEQVSNVCATTIVQDAWERGQELTVHDWAYGLKDGLVHDLNCSASNALEATGAYQTALRDL
jgi:carbonic anhydrase